MFGFDLKQFAYSGTGGGKKPHHEIPGSVTVLFESRLEELVICITDYVFKEVLLLDLHETHFELLLLDKLQIFINCLKPEVYCLGFVMFHKIALIGEKILSCHFLVFLKEMRYRPHIGADGIRRQILAGKK